MKIQPTEVEPSPFSSSSPPFFSQDSLLYRPCNLEIPPPPISSHPSPSISTHTHNTHTHTHTHNSLCCTVILYICPLATEHCGYCILLFFFSCHICMMSVLYFMDATTTFLWPLGDNKGFYSILSLPFLSVFLHCVSFLVTSSFRLAFLVSRLFLFAVFHSPGCCV